MDDNQALIELRRIANDYLLGLDPDIQKLLHVIEDNSSYPPIKEVLYRIEKYKAKPFTESDTKLVRELLYLYG
ncbi:hypothetical protein EHZ47_22535 [Aeromonas jandaei]|uniref:hypothetical protein n=1 Tax=Aeromonas jandaei TaxID=650 RepID=UPI000F54B9CC|nr:hypothetical protein [Aeromonas jandaei]RQM70030.1 hypothetical protein EHZ47_22535 [Aeromonas jandaei]